MLAGQTIEAGEESSLAGRGVLEAERLGFRLLVGESELWLAWAILGTVFFVHRADFLERGFGSVITIGFGVAAGQVLDAFAGQLE